MSGVRNARLFYGTISSDSPRIYLAIHNNLMRHPSSASKETLQDIPPHTRRQCHIIPRGPVPALRIVGFRPWKVPDGNIRQEFHGCTRIAAMAQTCDSER
jgi:hypothetical protein